MAHMLYGTIKKLKFGLLDPKLILVVQLLISYPMMMSLVQRRPQTGNTTIKSGLNLMTFMLKQVLTLTFQHLIQQCWWKWEKTAPTRGQIMPSTLLQRLPTQYSFNYFFGIFNRFNQILTRLFGDLVIFFSTLVCFTIIMNFS